MTMPAQHPYQSKQDYATPTIFISAVQHRLGIDSFWHDFAADDFNHKAITYFDAAADAFSFPHWEWYTDGGWGWCNPPYTAIGPWAKRCYESSLAGAKIAFLVPASVGSNWFRDYIDGKAEVLFLNGRLAFMPDKPTWLYPKDCMLVLFGNPPKYEVWNWRKDIQP
jgi:hypothetical protein